MATETTALRETRAKPAKIKIVGDWMYPVVALLAILVAWDLSIRIFEIKEFLLPSPAAVYNSLIVDWDELGPNAVVTLIEIMAGFSLSVVVGIGIALAIVSSRIIDKTAMPLIVGAQVIPKIAIAPLFVVWFGFGFTPKILVAFLIAVFPMIISGVVGLRSIDVNKLHLARSMGASSAQTFLKIRLPNAMPSLFGGLKLSITAAVIGAIVGEFIGADEGLGKVMMVANGELETALLFSGIALLSVIGVILFLIIDILERIVIRWHVSQRIKYEVGV